jgi:hypothetical protein
MRDHAARDGPRDTGALEMGPVWDMSASLSSPPARALPPLAQESAVQENAARETAAQERAVRGSADQLAVVARRAAATLRARGDRVEERRMGERQARQGPCMRAQCVRGPCERGQCAREHSVRTAQNPESPMPHPRTGCSERHIAQRRHIEGKHTREEGPAGPGQSGGAIPVPLERHRTTLRRPGEGVGRG